MRVEFMTSFALALLLGISQGCQGGGGFTTDGSAVSPTPGGSDAVPVVASASWVSNTLSLTGSSLDSVTGVSLAQNGVSIPLQIVGKTARSLTAALASSARLSKTALVTLSMQTAQASTPVVLTVDLSGTVVSNFTSTGISDLATATTVTLSADNKVGIGTLSPSASLDVEQTSTATSGAVGPVGYTLLNVAPTSASTGSYAGTASVINVTTDSNLTAPTGNVMASGIRAAYNSVTNSGAGTMNVATGSYNLAYNQSTGTITTAYGTFGRAHNASTGTLGTAYGNYGVAVNASTGTITTAVGAYGLVNNSGTITTAVSLQGALTNPSGSVGTWYGLYIPAVSGNAPTTAYDLYIADTNKNYIAGNVGIGTSSPTGKLDVVSNAGTRTVTLATTASNGKQSIFNATDNTQTVPILLQNLDGTAGVMHALTIQTQMSYTSGAATPVGSGQISFVKEQEWTSTASTQNSAITFLPALAGNVSERMRISSSGNVGIGVTNPTTKLQVAGEIAPGTDNSSSLGDGSLRFTAVYATNGTVQTSDRREKTDIQPADLGLDFILKLQPVSFRWKSGPDTGLHYGLIAQDTEQAIAQSRTEAGREPASESPGAVVWRDPKTGRYGLRYTELLAPVIKALQELSFESTETRDEIAALRAENAGLKARLERLEKIVSQQKK